MTSGGWIPFGEDKEIAKIIKSRKVCGPKTLQGSKRQARWETVPDRYPQISSDRGKSEILHNKTEGGGEMAVK